MEANVIPSADDVVSESAPGALAFEEIRPKRIYSKPKNLFSQRKVAVSKGPQGRHNAIGDPTAHRPCTLSGQWKLYALMVTFDII